MQDIHLDCNQIITWKQAYDWAKLPEPRYICLGNMPNTTDGKEFLKPFIQKGYIHKDTLKNTGVFRLTDKGIANFKKLKKALSI
jgi:hypothetical protein